MYLLSFFFSNSIILYSRNIFLHILSFLNKEILEEALLALEYGG
jgi:hypothetical protein